MELVKITKIFDVQYGNQFDLNKMTIATQGEDCINFISRSAKNNGLSAKIKQFKGIKPFEPGLITVALGGSSLSTFVQPSKFYTGQNVAVLTPITKLTEKEKLFYCLAIYKNAFRYTACGREANRTLKDLLIPDKSEIPNWVNSIKTNYIKGIEQPYSKTVKQLKTDTWSWFKLEKLFEIKKGKRLTKANMKEGETPFIGSIDSNNGYRQYIGQKPNHERNTITVNYNGSVAEAFYQPAAFWASDDVNVLYPKFKMNQFTALFIIALIKMEKYRFNYGRKWHLERMNASEIKLPIDQNREPDYKFMESYIKSLPFSKKI